MTGGTTIEQGRAGRRARRVAETRRRIIEATIELHTSVGVGRTSISAITERAGVQRHTVYAHFRDEAELLRACTGLWFERNPSPDHGAWAAIADPGERLGAALDELYAYYERVGDDLAAVFTDAENVPIMAGTLARRAQTHAEMAEVLARGRGARGRRRARLLAALRHAVHIDTWRSLTEEGGLSRAEAVALMRGMVEAAGAPVRSPAAPAGR
jgi:AcrR family transcriptional regulator